MLFNFVQFWLLCKNCRLLSSLLQFTGSKILSPKLIFLSILPLNERFQLYLESYSVTQKLQAVSTKRHAFPIFAILCKLRIVLFKSVLFQDPLYILLFHCQPLGTPCLGTPLYGNLLVWGPPDMGSPRYGNLQAGDHSQGPDTLFLYRLTKDQFENGFIKLATYFLNASQ